MISIDDFITACKDGDIESIKRYEGNVNDRAINIYGKGNIVIEGDDTLYPIIFDWPGLVWAAHNGHTDCVRELIALGADVNAKVLFDVNFYWTALMWAAHNGHTDCVKELIALGADLEMKDRKGRTALMWALEFKHYDVAQLLVENGAKIYAKLKDGVAAIDFCKNKRIKEKLIKISQRHITAAIKSSEKPVIIKGFDSEL